MKQFLVMLAVMAVMGCGKKKESATDRKPLTKEQSVEVIDTAIRKAAKKPTGELTKEDFERPTRLDLWDYQLTNVKGLEKLTQLTELDLYGNKLTDLKGLEKLTQLKFLHLGGNPGLSETQITKLQKALPNCNIAR